MVDALLLQQTASPVAFDHGHITPFKFSSVSSLRPICKSTGILINVQRRVTAVEFLSKVLLWTSSIYFYVDDSNRHGHCAPPR